MFGISTQISSRCRISGTPVTLEQSGLAIKNRDAVEDIHFGIHWGAANGNSCCADSLCMEMMFLRDGDIAGHWLAEEPDSREIFTLPEAVEFSARFFVPSMS
jgi:hypothetical protein